MGPGSAGEKLGGFVDLHCHWIAGVDDGVKTVGEGRRLLEGLGKLGFQRVVATPHMRPGMFDNDRATLEKGYASMLREFGTGSLPDLGLASEHFFDEIVYERLMTGKGLPYPGNKAVLVELNPHTFPPGLAERLFDVRCSGLLPVIAHPERYEPVWRDASCLDPLLEAGACLLLDVCALVGKYGRAPQRAAEQLLEEEVYDAACTDAHRVEDVAVVERSIAALRARVGAEETNRLLSEGPRTLLNGNQP
jgi:protein-tyrosine phosphatase